jgi:hypothetical protein
MKDRKQLIVSENKRKQSYKESDKIPSHLFNSESVAKRSNAQIMHQPKVEAK